MNTIGKELVNFLCSLFDLSFGQNIFFMRLPETEEKDVFWLLQNSGYVSKDLKTKQKIKTYSFVLNYRNVSAQAVDEKIEQIETVLNRLTCTKLENYVLYSLSVASLGSHEDADAEGRYVGSIQIDISILDDYSNINEEQEDENDSNTD